VAEHERKLGVRKLAVRDVEVGPADPAGRDLEKYLPLAWLRIRQLALPQRLSGGFQDHRSHVLIQANRIAAARDSERRHL